MPEAVIVALISSFASVVAVVWQGKSTQDKVTAELHTQNEVQNVRIDNLAKEVSKHNEFGVRIPKLEGDIKLLEEKLSVANHRIKDLEEKLK